MERTLGQISTSCPAILTAPAVPKVTAATNLPLSASGTLHKGKSQQGRT